MKEAAVKKSIVVVGSINADLVVTTSHIPQAGETVSGNGFQMHAGGKGGNQAVAVGHLGFPVEMVGRVGSDEFGAQLRGKLRDAGVGVEAVEVADGPSGVALITVNEKGENCIVVVPGANAQVTPQYVEAHWALIGNAGLVLLQLEIPLETVIYVAHRCHIEGIPVILDPAPAVDLPQELLRHVTWFTPNEIESAFYVPAELNLSAEAGLDQVAGALRARGLAGVILKLGRRGAYLASETVKCFAQASHVSAIDTTAAGDAFNGAFAVGLMQNKSLSDCIRFAVAAAGVSVTRAGAQSSMPSYAEVEWMLSSGLGAR